VVTEPADTARPVLWERIGSSGPGRRPSLSHDAIARASIALADTEGIDAVSMRRIAKELGVGTMSLYRYVESREELVDLMVDAAMGEFGYAETSVGSWRETLVELAHTCRRLMRAHPWLAPVFIGRPPMGPRILAMLEETLARLDQPGLRIDDLLDLQATVTQFVMGYVLAENAEQESQRTSGLDQEQWRARIGPYLMRVLDRGQHPYVRRVVMDAEDYPDPDEVFARRLGYVIDGLAAGLGLENDPG
jgi:AcrR family transcriptional regulator